MVIFLILLHWVIQSKDGNLEFQYWDLVPPRAQISSGSGSACWAKFGFGFHRVFKFQQSSGSGLSGFTSKVRVLGFIGFGF